MSIKTSPRTFKERIRDTTLIVLITFVSFFIIGEILTRIFRKESTSMFVMSENPKLVYELNKAYTEINSFGMRDVDIDVDDIKNLYKIAVIGDSHTYSSNVKNMVDSFPSQLEKYLNQNSGQPLVKVLNFGVPGYNTAQELEVLQSRAFMFEPKLVILQYCLNDTHVCNYIQPEYKTLNSLIHKSQFLVVLWKNIIYSSFGKKFLLEWVGNTFPDALLFQAGLVGTQKSVKTEVAAHKPHPPRTKDRVPARYHYMLGEENWRMHLHSFAQVAKQKGVSIACNWIYRG